MRYKLDPFSPNGISVESETKQTVRQVQSHGYVGSNNSTSVGTQNILYVDAAPETGDAEVLYVDSANPTDSYYFIGGHRYLITAELNDPVHIDSFMLLENGSYFLLENIDKLILG